MNIVYYSSLATGSGHVVGGISVFNALIRKGVPAEFTILHSSAFGFLADRMGARQIKIPAEDEHRLDLANFESSRLFKSLSELKPDILLVDLSWFTLHSFIGQLPCRKILLCRQIADSAFRIPIPGADLVFNPDDWDAVLSTEPFRSSIQMKPINPMVIRNRDEVLPKNEALETLNLTSAGKNCLFAFNGKPGEFEEKKKTYSYLSEEGYTMVYSTNFGGGLFPVVDYFNAFDLLITGAGYNAFWEAVYFEKEAIFVPVPRRFENQRNRVEECSGYIFKENGADQLIGFLINL